MALALMACACSHGSGGPHEPTPLTNEDLGMPDGRTIDTHEFRLPAGCAVGDRPPWIAPDPTLITSEPQYQALLRCGGTGGSSAPPPSGIDFQRQSLALFGVTAKASAPVLDRLVEDGGSLVAVFTARTYCGGAAPPEVAGLAAVLVDPGPRKLDVVVHYFDDPSCSGPPRP